MNDSPECYGIFNGDIKCCECSFCESCKYYTATIPETKKIEHASLHEYNENVISHNEQGILPIDLSPEKLYSHEEVVALSAFLLRIARDRRLGPIITAKLTGAASFAEIARCEGVTRQAIHKRVGKQLAKLLGYKNRQLTDSRLLTLTKDEFQLLKLVRADADDEDIMELMHLSKNDLRERKKTLDYKISKWT